MSSVIMKFYMISIRNLSIIVQLKRSPKRVLLETDLQGIKNCSSEKCNQQETKKVAQEKVSAKQKKML